MTFLRNVATLAVCLTVAQAVTPMEKVINLLTELKASTVKSGKEEAKTYGEFACFCKDNTASKSKAITEGQDKIDTTVADIGKKTATRKDKITSKGKEQQKIEDTTKKLAETTELYNTDKHNYQVTNADLTQAVNSAKRAHKALTAKKGASFLDIGTKSDLRKCLDLAEAMDIVEPQKNEAVTSFLQVDPSDPAYKFHSDQILKIISDLQKDFQKEKDSVNAEWTKTDKSFKAEKKQMEAKIKTAQGEVKKLTGEISKLKGQIAKLNEDLVSTTATLKDDSDFLSDLTTRCEEKGQAWDQRSKTRSDEVAALTKALDIITKRAKALDSKVNKRALLIAKKPVAPVAKAAVKAPVKAASKPATEAKPVEAKKTVSFLQMRRTQKAQEGISAMLRQEGSRLHSDMLSSVAEQIMADPFVKIKGLIQGLIERLLEESKNEATKKGFCDTELGKSEETRANRFADINQLDADLSALEAKKTELTFEISELKDALTDLKAELKKATGIRTQEKADNADTIQKAKDGAVAVGEALVTLKDFYASAAKESFLQVSASPIDEKKTQDGGFDSAYQGDQSSSKAILGLLEVIKSDFERTNKKTEAAEADAHAQFIEFDRASKADIAGKTTKQTLDEQDLESTKSAIDDGMKDMKSNQNLLDSALKNIEELKPTCIDTGMSFAERTKKREDEIKALGKALCMLDPDQKKVC